MAVRSHSTPQRYHLDECGVPAACVLSAYGSDVQLLSDVIKPVATMQPRDQGVMKPAPGGMSDAEQCYQFEKMIDCGVLREGFAHWYKAEGRKIEKELVVDYNHMVVSMPQHRQRTAGRFRDIARKAIELVEEEDDDTMYRLCLAVLGKSKHQLDGPSFLELQEAICSVNESLNHCPSASDFCAAASRQLKHLGFINRVAAMLPSEAEELPSTYAKVRLCLVQRAEPFAWTRNWLSDCILA